MLRVFEKSWESNEAFQDYFAAWWKLREATLRKSGDPGTENPGAEDDLGDSALTDTIVGARAPR